MQEVLTGLQQAYAAMKQSYEEKTGRSLERIAAIGISAMMHGYLPLDADMQPLTEFRTWQNTTTGEAAQALSTLFGCNIPLRWSIAHLEQARRNAEPHLKKLHKITTLAGYIHGLLTGNWVLGIGDASGMFPIDSATCSYDAALLLKYEKLLEPDPQPWQLQEVLPEILLAGEDAGALTEAGARLLDPTGMLQAGIPFAPPEGDAGTGMTATNAVAVGTGNISVGTSVFAMFVLDRKLQKVSPLIDMVTTPEGKPVAMVHCNNGTADLNRWLRMLQQTLALFGQQVSDDDLYGRLFALSETAQPDCGGLLAYNLLVGEPILEVLHGAALTLRPENRDLQLPEFIRAQIFGCFCALRRGVDPLFAENILCTRITAHGGIFKTPLVAQRALAAAINRPVTTLQTAGEGGAYGMALLCAFLAFREAGQTLDEYLQTRVFSGQPSVCLEPVQREVEGFAQYYAQYETYLPCLHLASAAEGNEEDQ